MDDIFDYALTVSETMNIVLRTDFLPSEILDVDDLDELILWMSHFERHLTEIRNRVQREEAKKNEVQDSHTDQG